MTMSDENDKPILLKLMGGGVMHVTPDQYRAGMAEAQAGGDRGAIRKVLEDNGMLKSATGYSPSASAADAIWRERQSQLSSGAQTR